MKNDIKTKFLVCMSLFFLAASARAEIIWNCNGANIESLQITSDSGSLHATISWDYAGGDAIDEETFLVHQDPTSTNGQVTYLDGSGNADSKFILELTNAPGKIGSIGFVGMVHAKNTEAPFPYDGPVSCDSVASENSGVGNPYDPDCGDPNSDAGIAAWDSGKCGAPGGGSN